MSEKQKYLSVHQADLLRVAVSCLSHAEWRASRKIMHVVDPSVEQVAAEAVAIALALLAQAGAERPGRLATDRIESGALGEDDDGDG